MERNDFAKPYYGKHSHRHAYSDDGEAQMKFKNSFVIYFHVFRHITRERFYAVSLFVAISKGHKLSYVYESRTKLLFMA